MMLAIGAAAPAARVAPAGRSPSPARHGALVAAFWLAAPLFATLGKFNLVIFFVVVVAANVFSGVPIAFSFALATFGYLALTTRTPLLVMVGRMDEGMSHLILLAVPLFIFLGALIEMTGMARAMIQFLASLLGHVRGGLSYVLIGAMYLVSGISGSKIADMAAIAPVLFPEMKKRGAKPGDLVALLSATGAQTETIPPSIVLITIGSVTGVSIAALFTGGLLPAVVLGLALCVVVWWRYRREDLSGVQRYSKREIGKLLMVALPAVLLPFVIRAAVVEGVATATEVSTIGIVYSALVGLLRLPPVRLAAPEADAHRHGLALGRDHLHRRLRHGHGLGPHAVGLLAGPGALDGRCRAVRTASWRVDRGLHRAGQRARRHSGHRAVRPAAVPHRQAAGVHEVHYAMVVIFSMGIGLFAPPFGVGYYGACAVSKVNPDEGIKHIWGYIAAMLVGLVIVAAFPWFSTGFLQVLITTTHSHHRSQLQ
jgi:TRAP-type C4-dicarboxylate transport system permease large subunit